MSRSAFFASSTLYSIPDLNGSSRLTTRGLVLPNGLVRPSLSTYTRFTRVISPSMMCAITWPVSMPSKWEMVPNVSPRSW